MNSLKLSAKPCVVLWITILILGTLSPQLTISSPNEVQKIPVNLALQSKSDLLGSLSAHSFDLQNKGVRFPQEYDNNSGIDRTAASFSEQSVIDLDITTGYLNVSSFRDNNLTDSSSINITGNAALDNFGLPGFGTLEDPYRIQNKIFVSNETEFSIKLENTTKYIAIDNNWISTENTTLPIAISLTSVINAQLSNNTFQKIDEDFIPLRLLSSSNISIIENVIDKTHGIIIENSTSFNLDGNNMTDIESNGVDITDSFSFTLSQNIVATLQITIFTPDGSKFETGWPLLAIQNCRNFEILENTFYGFTEENLVIRSSSNLFIHHNFVTNVGGASFLADHLIGIIDTNNAVIMANVLSDSKAMGVFLESSRDIEVIANTISGTMQEGFAAHGIAIISSSNILVESNEISDTEFRGIAVSAGFSRGTGGNMIDYGGGPSFNVTIRENTIVRNKNTGIWLTKSFDIEVEGNRILENGDEGVHTEESDNITILSNQINGNAWGIRIEGGIDIQISDNGISKNSFQGILVEGSSSVTIHNQNRVKENLENGIQIQNSFEISIDDNTIENNRLNGIKLDFDLDPIFVTIWNNTLSDHLSLYAIDFAMNKEIISTNILIGTNRFEFNSAGIRLDARMVLVTDNLFVGLQEGEQVTNTAIELSSGAQQNMIRFNTFNDSKFSHVTILSQAVDDLRSLDNVVAWNNFFDVRVNKAFDELSDNYFIYNYWDDNIIPSDLDADGFLNDEFQIDHSAASSSEQSDPYPLAVRFNKDLLSSIGFLPDPLFINMTENQLFNSSSASIELEWRQYIASNMFAHANFSSFSYDLELTGPGIDDTLKLVSGHPNSSYILDISARESGYYELTLISHDIITGLTSELTIRIGIDISVEESFWNPVNIALSVLGLIVLSGIIVNQVTTYRHNKELERQADVEGRAKEYIDFVKDLQDD